MKVVFLAAEDIKPGRTVVMVSSSLGDSGGTRAHVSVHVAGCWESHGNGYASLIDVKGQSLGMYSRLDLIAVPNEDGRYVLEAMGIKV